jgi:hypothetical protein
MITPFPGVNLHILYPQKVRILSDRIPTPDIAMVDENGVLIDDVWGAGVQPDASWRRNTTGNCLRDAILEEIEQIGLFHERNFQGRHGGNNNNNNNNNI